MGKKRKELSIQDGGDDDSTASHPHVNHSSSRPPIAKKTKASAAKKSKPEAAAGPPTNQHEHEPKKSQQVVLSAANRSLMTYSPGPLNQEAQKDSPPSQDSTPEADIEFVSLALYGYCSIYIYMYSIV